MFHIIEKVPIFTFADDNILSAFPKPMAGLLHTLQSEFLKLIKCFKENKMMFHAHKLKVCLIHKRKQDHTNELVQIEEQSIKVTFSFELLGIEFDDQVCFKSFNQYDSFKKLLIFLHMSLHMNNY